MTPLSGPELLAALATGVAVAALAGRLLPPTPRLAPRVRPYAVTARSNLGRGADAPGLLDAGPALSVSTFQRLCGPLVEALARRLGGVLDHVGDEVVLQRLRQAGFFQDVPEQRRAQEYRVRQLTSAAVGAVVLGIATLLLTRSTGLMLAGCVGGFVFGATRWRGRVDRAIEDRRRRMQIELYTVNQLLAMHVRVGGGVVQAMRRLVERGRGEVVAEFAEVLAAHRGGRRIEEALAHAASATAEPHAARTYKLLASGAAYGADLAAGLRALSEDIRDQRAEALRRTATKRRMAMLVPIIAILAPVMLLFIAAPLPSLVFGGFGS